MKSKMLGALALFTLIGALFILQSAGTGPPTVDAATGSIDALNMGTCLTTDATLFKDEDCDLSGEYDGVKWEIRDKVVEVSTLYATYAHDPKTSSDAPRAILTNSDLIKISIADTGRDKRTGVLVRGRSYEGVNDDSDADDTAVDFDEDQSGSLAVLIRTDLDADGLSYQTAVDLDTTDTDEDIKFTSEEAGNGTDGIWLYQGAATVTTSEVTSSGNYTLNFTRDGGIGDGVANPWQFKPADFDVANGAEVRFYGCVSTNATCGDDGTSPNFTDPIKKLTELEVDEDASNGDAGGNTAPWLGVNASVPSGSRVVILAIYYRTSNEENLVGGQTYRECSGEGNTPTKTNGDTWRCSPDGTLSTNDGVGGEDNVVFTDNEKNRNTALEVRALADGNLENRSVDLFLTETGRFDGVYQGYLRLTDANGDGRGTGTSPDNWGRVVGDGKTDNSIGNAAVLAVQSGPVTIEYRDSSGTKRTLRIEIDNRAPTITVANPAHGAASGDQSPDFAGAMEDTDSGLVDGSFRLVVDNKVDSNGAPGSNSDYALEAKAPNAEKVILRTVSPVLKRATRIADYAGYSASDQTFGISDADALYALGDDACDDGQEVCHILSDEYDDGATRGTFEDSLRLDLWETEGETLVLRDKEFQIDFQAFVMDMAGNIGFSDSDPANPRFINDLGTETADRDLEIAKQVLGYYSAHIITLDEKDPEVMTDESATGYYGRTSDKSLIADRSGIVVVFDNNVAASSISTDTFTVELDDESAAQITDVEVDGKYVFLKLASELASDATPEIDIAQGAKVEDMAGNETFGRELEAFDAKDGISPRLTVTLSGGSGTGTGNEGPDKLTRDQIMVHVSSDEPLQGSPRVDVVCTSLEWMSQDDTKMDVDDYVANRMRASSSEPMDNPKETMERANRNEVYDYTCGYEDADSDLVQAYSPNSGSRALALPGENWQYTWQNPPSADMALEDGGATVVVFASDRSRYTMGSDASVRNWGSASADFTLDRELLSPQANGGGDLQPEDGGESKESRPFILIEFNEGTTVTLDSVELDDVEIADQFTKPAMNRFVYWPDTITQGDHEVEVDASDAAGNEVTFDYEFKVVDRGDFVIELQAGWNAISVPATPVDTAIGSVFTDAAVTTVIGWDTQGWRIAVRRDGVWESNQQYGALNDIQSKYGYWVKSDRFVSQPVALQGPIGRDAGSPGTPDAIDTIAGWNFVGVIDQDGDQTEGHFGEGLRSGIAPVSAGEYLGSHYIRAYTWDPTFSRFENLAKDVQIEIGGGVWVYYEGGIAP
ncbi:MAG: Ig-like domain-containing protein [Chloroflexi bacterium]|nr:Ig-like domain-containing protein [Chloroflexota bacterium]